MMRLHVFKHVPFEGLGCVEAWFLKKGYHITTTEFYAGGKTPSLKDIDFLVIMGGPMSVNAEADYPWLVEELDFVKKAVTSHVPVLGVCLGAQLIAKAMGARVYQGKEKEIGWFPISGIGGDEQFQFPKEANVFHWHGETFDLPEGAKHIARSLVCEHQAFQIGKNVIGLQFHLEMTEASIRAIVEHCRGELEDGEYIQTEHELLNANKANLYEANQLMHQLLDYLEPK